ncbi:MAG TPA: peptide-methionine (S)-S-oxide reductase MsrA [Candidatus Thermoplasmatota archaeon]|nr:peptide-methionine (S)-S-oxide reductase MsrA [Candidatus Thermoplasmatota archaeon]
MDGAGPSGVPASGRTEVATLGGGCFWCVEAAYRELDGVISAISGYAGGHVEDPDYESVCAGTTGHAEVVQVTFDPAVVSYRDILGVFFTVHDPTQLNRQGNDVGTQYRSVIFTHSAEQEREARAYIDALERERVHDDPVVTEVLPAPRFWPAEDYHQDYYARNPHQGYCMAVIRPKMAKFRKAWAMKLKAEAQAPKA